MKSFSNEAYYRFFSTLANRTNLAIIDVLIEGSKAVSEIAVALEQGESEVLANLQQLEKCVIVKAEGTSASRRFSLNREVLEPLSETLDFHVAKYCPNLSECIPPRKLRQYLQKEAEKATFIKH